MKSEKELNELKAEFEALKKKFEEPDAEELEQLISGRHTIKFVISCDDKLNLQRDRKLPFGSGGRMTCLLDH